jgi:hypothetical protein
VVIILQKTAGGAYQSAVFYAKKGVVVISIAAGMMMAVASLACEGKEEMYFFHSRFLSAKLINISHIMTADSIYAGFCPVSCFYLCTN